MQFSSINFPLNFGIIYVDGIHTLKNRPARTESESQVIRQILNDGLCSYRADGKNAKALVRNAIYLKCGNGGMAHCMFENISPSSATSYRLRYCDCVFLASSIARVRYICAINQPHNSDSRYINQIRYIINVLRYMYSYTYVLYPYETAEFCWRAQSNMC